MDWKATVAAPLAALMMVAGGNELVPAKGWSAGSNGNNSKAYAIGVDPQMLHAGQRSLSVQSRSEQSAISHGAAIQYAYGYQGKRVRFSGWLRSAEVKTWAGAFMHVQGDSTERFFGSSPSQLLPADLPFGTGSATSIDGWTEVSVVADVPNQPGAMVSVGLMVIGQGQAWLSGLRFEEVGREVPLTLTRVGLDLDAYATARLERERKLEQFVPPTPPRNLSLE